MGERYGYHMDGCERLRTVDDGCERLRAQTQLLANTALPPNPQDETGTLATHSGKIYSGPNHAKANV